MPFSKLPKGSRPSGSASPAVESFPICLRENSHAWTFKRRKAIYECSAVARRRFITSEWAITTAGSCWKAA